MVGTSVYIRTSGEEVFVLGEVVLSAGRNDYPKLGDKVYFVRRPVVGQNGTQHITEVYYPQELITKDEVLAEREAEQARFEQRVEKARKQAGLDGLDNETKTEPVLN